MCIDLKHPIATIPSLAIHLNREANKKSSINAQTDITPILLQHPDLTSNATPNTKEETLDSLLKTALSDAGVTDVTEILDHELFFYDTQPPALTGLNQNMISSARLDNLAGCYIGLQSLIQSTHELKPCMLVCHDHEEVGSQSHHGADSHFVRDILQRLTKNAETYSQVTANSLLVSVDSAHAIHPNFPSKHDAEHGPILNAGPVIKYNASQRYATNSQTSSLFLQLAKEENQPIQQFAMRNDMGCGSTIGPMSSAHLGMRSIDVGIPQWGMHSIREVAGAKDAFGLTNVLSRFYKLDDINALIR